MAALKKHGEGARLAKMVSRDTATLISILSNLVQEEQRREKRVSDNETIRLAVIEAIEARSKNPMAELKRESARARTRK